MERSPEDMAEQLIALYTANKGRFRLSLSAFRRMAGKVQIKKAYVDYVDDALQEEGYKLIDLREAQDHVAVVKQATVMKYADLSGEAKDREPGS